MLNNGCNCDDQSLALAGALEHLLQLRRGPELTYGDVCLYLRDEMKDREMAQAILNYLVPLHIYDDGD